MGELFNHYEYIIAWTVYLLAGAGCCAVWWKMTSSVSHRGWRDLARGFVFVLIFTPWYTGEAAEFFAPAFVILLMDLLLDGAAGGLKGGLALLISNFAMLLVLTFRLIRYGKHF